MKKVYLLLFDVDGTTWSRDQSVGVAVTSLEEAQKWGKECNRYGYSHSYEEILICESIEEATRLAK